MAYAPVANLCTGVLFLTVLFITPLLIIVFFITLAGNQTRVSIHRFSQSILHYPVIHTPAETSHTSRPLREAPVRSTETQASRANKHEPRSVIALPAGKAITSVT